MSTRSIAASCRARAGRSPAVSCRARRSRYWAWSGGEGLCGLEVVEVSPPYDTSDITALFGVRVVVEALARWWRMANSAATNT
ncbi:MAG: arginase family protein [Pseudolabrys sp.]